jgi:MFS family permease
MPLLNLLPMLILIGIVCPLYGISLFLPSIIRGLGYTSSTAQLLTVPIYITASVLAVVVAWYSDRVGKRYPFILVCLCIMAVGFIMCVASATPGVIYAGVFIAACALYPAFPGNITWLSNSRSSDRDVDRHRTDCMSRSRGIYQARHRASHSNRCWQPCRRYVHN